MDAPETGLSATRESIEARLRTHPRLNGVQGFLDGVTGGEATVTNEAGVLIPYWVLSFGGRAQVRSGAQGITGSRGNLRRFSFGTEVYAKSAKEVLRVGDDVWDVLEGFVPEGASEITGAFSGKIQNPIQFRQNHTRDGFGFLWECFVNL